MPEPRLRALLLAAGRGERLRPLTLFVPKPLLPVAGEPVAGLTLRHLRAAGCEAAALNLHHLGGAIRDRFGAHYAGLPLRYSVERELLGTRGALAPLRGFLGQADVVALINGDSLCAWPLRRMIEAHRKSGAAATLLLAERADPAEFGGGLGVDRGGRVVALSGGETFGEVARRAVFAGAHILSPRLLARVPDAPGDIILELYLPLLREGERLQAVFTRRPWHDLGTPARYLEAVLERVAARRGSGWVAPGAQVAPSARLRASVLEAGAVVGPGARLERCLLLPGARVEAGADLRETILGPDAIVAEGVRVERALVTAPAPLSDGRARPGRAVSTPLHPSPRRSA